MKNPWSDILKPAAEINARLVSETHPLKLFHGVDSRGRYLFIAEFPAALMPDKKSLPDLVGIKAAVGLDGSQCKLILQLNETANWELFDTLCNDLARASMQAKDEASAVAIIIRRLNRWQEFLRRQRPLILPLEEIKGLIGELLFLSRTVAPQYGWDSAIAFWKGPEDAPQDFAVHNTAVEVKCQSGSSKPWVRISSVDQLNPQLPKGYLVVQTLATADAADEDSFTLNTLADTIRAAVEDAGDAARERFENLLFLAGYLKSEHYDSFIFQRIATRSFALRDGFPRLQSAGIPAGIDRISYQLSLEACSPFEAALQL